MAQNIDEWEEDLQETETAEENEPDLARFDIMNYPADTTLKGYKDQWDNGQLIVPEFQRKYVWDQVRASKLIESFLLGLPVPGVFLYKERESSNFLIIDGHQRIHSVVSFLKASLGKKFTLKGVSKEWEGKSFDDLDEEDQFKLSIAVMRATIIQQINPDDKSSIYYIFERLNTGGVNLNPMEVRMCVSEGKFSALLRKLNRDPLWRNLIQKKIEDQRSRDLEWILRILALEEKGQSYEKPMKGFLNGYMANNQNANDEWAERKAERFVNALNKASKLSEKPFHFTGKLNYAVLDSIMVSLMESKIENDTELRHAYDQLIQDKKFLNAISVSTSDKQNVLDRIERTKFFFKAN